MTRLPISHPLQLSCTIFSYLALKNVVTLRCHSRSLENLGDIFIRIPYGRMFSRFDIIHERDGQTPHDGVRRACAFIAQQNFYNLETLMLWTAGLNFVKLHIELSSWQIKTHYNTWCSRHDESRPGQNVQTTTTTTTTTTTNTLVLQRFLQDTADEPDQEYNQIFTWKYFHSSTPCQSCTYVHWVAG